MDVPLVRRAPAAEAAERPGPEVRLRAEFAGREQEWTGQVVRTAGEIDAQTRMVTVIARVEDPYVREAAYLAQPGEFDAVRGEA